MKSGTSSSIYFFSLKLAPKNRFFFSYLFIKNDKNTRKLQTEAAISNKYLLHQTKRLRVPPARCLACISIIYILPHFYLFIHYLFNFLLSDFVLILL